MKGTFITPLLLILSALLFAGCNGGTVSDQEDNNEKLTVYTTIFPIEDFAKKIGGNHVEVQSVYPPGADAHTYEPSVKKMMSIAEADLLMYNGAGLESFIEKIDNTLKDENVVKVEVSEEIELLAGKDGEEHGHESSNEHHHHDLDPHIWIDPEKAIMMADHIKNALIEEKPSAQSEFEHNFKELKTRLEQLDTQFRAVVDSASRKEILVSHAAYGYWEHRYGIKQISITGLSSENEPSQKQLQHIIETVKDRQIQYLIYDQNPKTKVAETIQKETGTDALTLHNLEYITEEDKQNREDYFSIMEKNIDTLKKALQ
ncbi:metal ABC transporter solute-binding protein, Zn/Mn family [Siminovitchia sediminis]|uniref:Metal ABC transporter solute-binding protein, Zn/Mn family n=1 Tax=Siminovitchia sediminis TaxID=1274353 RepID=A0ABW4KM29_9BACI